MKQDQTLKELAMESRWAGLWHRWAPALLTTPVMLTAYVGLAIVVPTVVQTVLGMVAGLAAATLVTSLIVGLLCRVFGVYRAYQRVEGSPQRQGITASQLALIAAWFIYPRMGIEQSLGVYVVAFVVVGVIGALTLTVVAGRDGANHEPTTPHRFEHSTRGPRPTRVAPRWAQRTAAVLLVFGVISFVRLLTDGTMHFLWGGIILLALGAVLPSLAVVLGGGSEPPE